VSTQSDRGERRGTGERGTALVEFALIFPIFMTVVLGMFSGGQSYNRKIAMTNAVSEASRYGATLAPSTLVAPPPPAVCSAVPATSAACGIDQWVRNVAAAVIQNAEGDLNASASGREICVAYVHPAADSTASHNQISHMLKYTTSDSAPSAQEDGVAARCIANDGRPSTEKRVQVVATRSSPLEALFFSYSVTLTAQSITRFEATSY